jgi:hyperosmotically inducible protein
MKLGVISMGMAVGLGVALSTFAGLGIAATQDVDGGARGGIQETRKDDRSGVRTPSDDAHLGGEVNTALQNEKDLLKGGAVNIMAKDGVVTLTGTLPTDAQKKKCEEVAKGVKGVKSVVNKITAPPPDKDKDGGK